MAGLSMKPRLTMPLAAWPVSSAFSDNFIRGAAPWPRRSSGTKAAPIRRRSFTLSVPAALAFDDDGAFAVATAALPTTPRTIRPGRCRQRRRCRRSRRRALRAKHRQAACREDRPASQRKVLGSRAAAPIRRVSRPLFTSPMSAPTIMRASEAAVSCARIAGRDLLAGRAGWSRCRRAASPPPACG